MARDSQRQKVYNWEYRVYPDSYKEEMTLMECVKFVHDICKDYGVAPPAVNDGRRRRRAVGGLHRIALPKWSRNRVIILHELAHTLTMRYSKTLDIAAHGPEYVRVLIELLAKYNNASVRELSKSARASKIKIGELVLPSKVTRQEATLRKQLDEAKKALERAQIELSDYLRKKGIKR